MSEEQTGKTKVGEFRKPLSKRLHLERVVPAAVIIFILIMVAVFGTPALVRKYHAYELAQHKATAQKELKIAYSLQDKNPSQALVHAKKALAATPDDTDTVAYVAGLEEKLNPQESRQMYARALNDYKKEVNPDVDGDNPGVYWAAAVYADKAGMKKQAIAYYQKFINVADRTDVYQTQLVYEANLAITRLQN